MKKKEKRIYEAPQLTTVTFKAERGYAESGALTSFYIALGASYASESGVSNGLESRTDGGNWGDGSWY